MVKIDCTEKGCTFTKRFWEDGTPAIERSKNQKKDVPPEVRKYYDLYHYDSNGDIVWELTVAEHEAREERLFLKNALPKMLRRVDYKPADKVRRNGPCPFPVPSGQAHKYKHHASRFIAETGGTIESMENETSGGGSSGFTNAEPSSSGGALSIGDSVLV